MIYTHYFLFLSDLKMKLTEVVGKNYSLFSILMSTFSSSAL